VTSDRTAGTLRAPSVPVKSTIEQNRRQITAKINEAALGSGRNATEICVVAITKYVEAEAAIALARLGQSDLGENRADALEAKARAFEAAGISVRWHFVGHLQRNKARRVARIADVIHSVDTPQLIRSLDRVAGEEGRPLEIFLEVQLTDEQTKHGFPPAGLGAGLDALRESSHLRPLGIMGMSPADRNSRSASDAFGRLRSLADEMETDTRSRSLFVGNRVRTSMGMSGDYTEAVAAGADYLRIGSSFFDGVDQAIDEVPA